jgi:hypothetical protein
MTKNQINVNKRIIDEKTAGDERKKWIKVWWDGIKGVFQLGGGDGEEGGRKEGRIKGMMIGWTKAGNKVS